MTIDEKGVEYISYWGTIGSPKISHVLESVSEWNLLYFYGNLFIAFANIFSEIGDFLERSSNKFWQRERERERYTSQYGAEV